MANPIRSAQGVHQLETQAAQDLLERAGIDHHALINYLANLTEVRLEATPGEPGGMGGMMGFTGGMRQLSSGPHSIGSEWSYDPETRNWSFVRQAEDGTAVRLWVNSGKAGVGREGDTPLLRNPMAKLKWELTRDHLPDYPMLRSAEWENRSEPRPTEDGPKDEIWIMLTMFDRHSGRARMECSRLAYMDSPTRPVFAVRILFPDVDGFEGLDAIPYDTGPDFEVSVSSKS